LLSDEYTVFQKRLRKLKVRGLLRRRSKYLEQKIAPISPSLDGIMQSLESGVWKTTSIEHIPLITTYAIIQWVSEYPYMSGGYGFPFDRPHLDFYRRLQNAHRLLAEIMDAHLRDSNKDNKPFVQIYKTFKDTVEDKLLNDLAASMEQKAEIFDKLRVAMRIALPAGKNGINDKGDYTDMKTIENKVTVFRKWLIADEKRKITYAWMIEQLDRYWEKLFADPLPVVTSEGTLFIQPQRTNNILEQFFRGEKHGYRKKSGTASLNKVLKTALAETPLVKNLKNSDYMEIILDGCSSLAERFSKINANLVQREMKNANNGNDRILSAIKNLIRDKDFTLKISSFFRSSEK